MPYIKQEDRRKFRTPVSQLPRPETAGELNYLISSICKRYLDSKGESYSTINEICGVLTCANFEFYRRVAEPYEDVKMEENGDVY